MNIAQTRSFDLCLSCELCLVVCPKKAITMEYARGQFLPKIKKENCINCGVCLKFCPGINIDPKNVTSSTNFEEISKGMFLECYTAFSNDNSIRLNSTSGGLITTLLMELLKSKDFDIAFVLNFDKFEGKPARLSQVSLREQVLNAAKSKYIPASIYNIVNYLKDHHSKKIIIVGTPCQLSAVQNYAANLGINGHNLLLFGLFCDQTMNYNILRYFEDLSGNNYSKIKKIDFRSKSLGGWPGDLQITCNSGKKIIYPRQKRIEVKKYFQLNRCLFCFDKLNTSADISFGDCYLERKHCSKGKSNVIIRTSKGKAVFDKYAKFFTLQNENIAKIADSQHLMDKKRNFEWAKIMHNKISDINYVGGFESKKEKQLLRLQKTIRWGSDYKLKRIKIDLTINRIKKKLAIVKEFMAYGVAFLFLFIKAFSPARENHGNQSNIIVVGVKLSNKGSQAMAFTLIDQLKQKFPNKNLYLFSTEDFKKSDEFKKKFSFDILPWNALKFLSTNICLFTNNENSPVQNKLNRVLRNACCIVDISGYALSSQWSFMTNLNYLSSIANAKKYAIPYYIFPQSIGPFHYPLALKPLLIPLIRQYLKYPKMVFVREKDGFALVSKYNANTALCHDYVLINKQYKLRNIFREIPIHSSFKIPEKSVAIIVNLRLFKNSRANNLYFIYEKIIKILIKNQYKIFLLIHSEDDVEISEKIISKFQECPQVTLFREIFDAFELEEMICQFNFIIASRYHSIIHAYKNGVPAIVLGWSEKYADLLLCLEQLEYYFDVRLPIDNKKIEAALIEMIAKYQKESTKIKSIVLNIQNQQPILPI